MEVGGFDLIEVICQNLAWGMKEMMKTSVRIVAVQDEIITEDTQIY
jgi:hypothetical protein